jgi:hypothetical protein
MPGYKQLSTLGNVVAPKNEFIFSFLVSGKIVHTQKILYQNGCFKLQFIRLAQDEWMIAFETYVSVTEKSPLQHCIRF